MRALTPRRRPRLHRTRLLSASLVVLVALLAGACGGDDSSEGGSSATTAAAAGDGSAAVTPVTGGQLTFAIDGDADGWTPANNRWTSPGLNVARAVYDPLAAFDAEGVARPYLAESITPNDDFTVWTIALRDGVTFHNGDPLTSEAVAANLEAVQASALIGPTFKLISGIEAIGPLEVTVTMAEPWSTFPVLIAQQPGFIVHPDMLAGDVTDPVGTGPFVFEEWVPGDHFTARRNPDYWRADAQGTQLPYLNEVEFRVITEALTRENGLKAGDFDAMHTTSSESLISYGPDLDPGEGFYTVSTPDSDDEQLIALNAQAGAADEPLLRIALAKATDRAALNDNLNAGFFDLADAPYASDSKWYTDPSWPDYDPEAATEIVQRLRDAGADVDVTLSVISRTEDIKLGQAVAEQWEAVGVDVEIEALDATALTLNIVTGQYEAAIFTLFNSPDPDGDYHFWDPTNITDPGEFSLAFTRYQNDELKAAMDAARKTTDDTERAAEYAEVWRQVADNVPVIWLWHTKYVIVARDEVQGLATFTLPDGEPAQLVNWGSVFLTEAWLDA